AGRNYVTCNFGDGVMPRKPPSSGVRFRVRAEAGSNGLCRNRAAMAAGPLLRVLGLTARTFPGFRHSFLDATSLRSATNGYIEQLPPPPPQRTRLAGETSPYLLQHKHNPVDWWPWGSDALAQAKRANKPILLSVGYAACHWCHVMAHESFEDAA